MRNLGGSIGISLATTLVARGSQIHQAIMAGHITPYDTQAQQFLHSTAHAMAAFSDRVTAERQAYGILYGTLVQNANLAAFIDTFAFLALLCLASVPVVVLFKKVRARGGPMAAH
jgi:DHA2 family multidrug resistance protein